MLTGFWAGAEWSRYEAALGRPGERLRELEAATWDTRVVSLSRPVELLWRDVRRSYHALINGLKADRQVGLRRPDGAGFLRCCPALHREAAGRVTRPAATWDVQADWIDRGIGLASVLERDGEPRGFIYTVRDGAWAYYFSAASLEPNVLHLLQWETMLQLKASGVEAYELGWQGHAKDDKGRNVEFFKRGFGGVDVPAWGER